MKVQDIWDQHSQDWRDPAQVCSWWQDASKVNPSLLKHRVTGDFWSVLEKTGKTLLVSREYEHLLMAISVRAGKPYVTYLPVPHPSGIVWNAAKKTLHVASTRNPNQILALAPVTDYARRDEMPGPELETKLLLPRKTDFVRGSMYLHDLALIGGVLHGNAVSMNAVVRFDDDGEKIVWSPKSISHKRLHDKNYLQLNSIAAGRTLSESFFSASVDKPGARSPGHVDFEVDGQGVVFSGATGEPIIGGLTRPHSARLHRNKLWVDNSGYGEVGYEDEGRFRSVAKLPGWTRGLAFADGMAIVGTSRIIPKFACYAPGLTAQKAKCGIHMVDVRTGKILGSLFWPTGNQIFAIECVPSSIAIGLPFVVNRKPGEREKKMFYTFIMNAD